MKKFFPSMMNSVNGGYIFTLLVYWLVPYIVMPTLQPLLTNGLWNTPGALVWIDLVCCAANGITLALVLKENLSDSFFDVSIAPKHYAQTVLTAVMLMFLWVLGVSLFSHFFYQELMLASNFFPMSEFCMTSVPILLVQEHPLIAIPVLSVLTPFTICGMFYASGFGPLACRKPVLGYLGVAFLLFLAACILNFWWEDPMFSAMIFLIQLPVHLIACWSYQYTDNLWTPIFSLGILNLATSVLFCLIDWL